MPPSTMAPTAKATATSTSRSRRRVATAARIPLRSPASPAGSAARIQITPSSAAAAATPAHDQRHPWWVPISAPVSPAPAAAPRLNRPWNRTNRPGVAARAAVAATFMATSTIPPAVTTPTRAAPRARRSWAAAMAATSDAHTTSVPPSTRDVPHRSVRAPPAALPTAAPARASERSSPNPPGLTPRARSRSAAATAHDPQKAPNREKPAPTGRSPSGSRTVTPPDPRSG
jgi:hypothetical protein